MRQPRLDVLPKYLQTHAVRLPSRVVPISFIHLRTEYLGRNFLEQKHAFRDIPARAPPLDAAHCAQPSWGLLRREGGVEISDFMSLTVFASRIDLLCTTHALSSKQKLIVCEHVLLLLLYQSGEAVQS